MAIVVRTATRADAAQLSEFGAATFRDTFERDNTPEDMARYLAGAFSPEFQAAEIADPSGLVLIAESRDGGDVADLIGYAHLVFGPAPAPVDAKAPLELKRLYVARPWHGRGVAQALMNAALETARSRGADVVWLGVWEHNPRAAAFYRKYGFARVGEHTFLLGADPQTDWIMVRAVVLAPDDTAVRTALWRALHVQADAPPHVFDDEVGLRLVAPAERWQDRPDMSAFTRPFRASILARARFVEDVVAEQVARGVDQYVILGAGLDTFAQRRPDLTSRVVVFEVDRPGPQEWKRQRLIDLGFGIPPHLRLVPVDFERGDAWWDRLTAAGFDPTRPAIVASTGVSMYLTREAIMATLRQVAGLASGSTLVMSFMVPIEWLDADVRPGVERAAAGARASGTPFISFFTPDEMVALARDAGFASVQHVSAATLADRYFAGRTDGLRPPNNSEELIVATTFR